MLEHRPDCTVSAEDQIQHLKTVAADHGWTVMAVFTDRPATVKKDRRPGEIGADRRRYGMPVSIGCCSGRSTGLDGHWPI